MNRYLSISTLCVLLLAATHAQAQELRGEDLVSNSPFLPPNWGNDAATPNKTQSPGDLEFRGVYQLGGEYFFNVYNKAQRKGTWVKLNEEVEGIRITRYSHDSDSIALHVNGALRDLALSKPSDAVMAVQLAANTAPARPTNVAPEGSGQSQNPNRVIRRTGNNNRVTNRAIPPPPPPPPTMRQNGGAPTGAPGAIRPPAGVRSEGTNTSAPAPYQGSSNNSRSPRPGDSNWTPPAELQAGPPDFIPGPPPNFTPELPPSLREKMAQTQKN